jgi:hypothetical protein
MKKIFTLFCFLLLRYFTFAQSTDQADDWKGYLGFSLGAGFGTGDFGSTDFDNPKAGIAKDGFQFSLIDFGFKFHKNIGLAACLSGNWHKMDGQVIADGFAHEFGGVFTTETGNWTILRLGAGPLFTLPFNKIDLDLRMLLCYIDASTPEINVWSGNTAVKQDSKSSNSTGFQIGTGIRYKFAPKTCLILRADYFVANPEFTVVATSYNYSASQTFNQEITFVNLSAGIGFRLK